MGNYIQPNVFYCGPTVIYLLFDYWGIEKVEFKKLVGFLFQRELKGTANSSMMFCPLLFGFKSYSFTGDISLLERLLDKRIPVIVLQNLSSSFKLGHFRIVLGIDNKNKCVYLRDPAKKKIQKMKYRKFITLWERGNNINNHRWAMIFIPEFFDFQDKEVINSALTALNIGTFYYLHFDYPRAYIEFKSAYERNKNDKDVLKYFAQVLIRLKNFDQAFKVITELVELDSLDPVAYDLLGLYFFYMGNYDKALLNLEQAIQLNKNSKGNTFIHDHYDLVKRFLEDRKKNEKN